MENVREILKTIDEFETFVYTRAINLLWALGYSDEFYLKNTYFEEEKVKVKVQDHFYCGQETDEACEEITLSIEELEMSNEDWSLFLDGIKQQTKLTLSTESIKDRRYRLLGK